MRIRNRRPSVYFAAETYESQERALRRDLANGCRIDVNRLCRAGRAALVSLKRGSYAKVELRNGRSVAVRTFVSQHPFLHLGYLLAVEGASLIFRGYSAR